MHKSLDSILSTTKIDAAAAAEDNDEEDSMAGKKKIPFSPWSITGYVHYTPGQTPHPGLVVPHKTDSTIFCSGMFCLTGFFCCC